MSDNDQVCSRCDTRRGDHTREGDFCPMAAFGYVRLTTWVFIPSDQYREARVLV